LSNNELSNLTVESSNDTPYTRSTPPPLPPPAAHSSNVTLENSTFDVVTAFVSPTAIQPPFIADIQFVKLELDTVNGDPFTTAIDCNPNPPPRAPLQSLMLVVETLQLLLSELAFTPRFSEMPPPRPPAA